MLSLKIVMTGGKTKTMRFTGNMSISEACKDIREKTEEGGPDHSLFRPPNEVKARKGQWLRADRTFNFYDVISGEELHYRKKHRMMKVALMDGQEKQVLVDESAPIREVVFEICDKLRIEKPWEEWSLTLGSTRAFLDPVLGLQEQGVTETTKVWLKKRFFWTDDKIDKSSPINLSLMYHQARFGITHGEHFVTEEEAKLFAALQLQQENGKYDAAKHKAANVFKEIDHYFEEKYQKKKKIHSAAFDDWKNLGNMTELDAMYQYMKVARGLATYGIVMFPVAVVVPGKREKVAEIVGVAKSEVLRMDFKNRAILERWPYMMIKRWAATNDMFTLDFGEKRENYYNCYLKNASVLGQSIQGYLDIMMRLRKQEGTTTEINDASATIIEDIDTKFGTVFESNTTIIVIGDSDGEEYDGGEVVGSDDDDPEPTPLPKKLLRPGNLGSGAGDDTLDPDNDPEPVPLPKKLLRPGKGPGGAGDRGPQKVRVTDLPTCIDAVDQLQTLIEIPLNPSKVVSVDPDKPRKAFQEGVARLPRELEDPQENAQNIASLLAGIIRAAREVAAKDDDISLLEAARRVAHETEEILKCSRDAADDDPAAIPLKKRLAVHKSALKGASTFAQGAVEGLLVDPSSEQLLLASAKQLADAVKRMATVASAIADTTESAKLEELSVKTITMGNNIPIKVKEMASVSSSKAEIAEYGTKSQAAAKRILDECTALELPEEDMRRIERACESVKASSVQLMDATNAAKSRAVQEREHLAECLRRVGENADAILDSTGNKAELEKHTNVLADNLAALIAAGKNLAKQDDETISLLTAAKGVSSAVEDLLSTTRNGVENVAATRAMLKTAQGISSAVKEQLSQESSKTLPYAIARRDARNVAAATSELCTKAREVLKDVEESRRKELANAVEEAVVAVQRMVKAVAVSEAKSAEIETQEKLVKALKAHTKVVQKLTTVGRACVPAIEKTAVKTELNQAVEKTAEQVRALVSALQAIPDEGAQAFNAVEKSLEKESVKIDSAMLNAAVGNLVQSEPRLEAVEKLQVSIVDLQRAMDVMRKAETASLVTSAKELVRVFGESVDASISVAAATSDQAEKQVVLQKARSMVPQIQDLLTAAKSEVRGVAQEDDVTFLDAARNVSRVVRGLMGSDEAEAIRLANKRFLPDLNALLKAAKAASEERTEDANMSLLGAAKSVSANLKELMSTMHEDELPIELIGEVKSLLAAVEKDLGEKGTARKQAETTANAVAAVKEVATDLLEVANNFEEGPEECNEAAQSVTKALSGLRKVPARAEKAPLDQIISRAEETAMAANRTLESLTKVPKVARSHPADLAPYVNNVIPAVSKLVASCNGMIEVLPDTKASAEAVQRVREIAEAVAGVLSNSRTAKSDPAADERMTTAMGDVRKAVRELISLTEQATPGLEALEEAARTASDAARFGVDVKDEPSVGLGGLQTASDELAAAVKKLQSVAAEDPAHLGDAAQEAAQAAVLVVSAAQNYDAISKAVAVLQRCEVASSKMRDAPSAEEVNAQAKAINSALPALITAMKEVSQNERNTDVKNAIKAAYGDIKPAQQELVEAAKNTRKEGGMAATADAADHLVDVLRAMVTAAPESTKAEALVASGKNVAAETKLAIQNAISVAKRPNDGFVQGQLLMACQDIDQSREELIATAKSMAPGRSELEAARKRVAKQVGEMEVAGIAAEIGLLHVATAKSRSQAQDSLLEAAEDMKGSLQSLLEAAKQKDMREMGARAPSVAQLVENTAAASRELAGTTGDESFQVVALASAKLTGEAALHFLDAALELNADPNAKPAQKALLSACSEANENVGNLKDALQTSAEGLARCEEAAAFIKEQKGNLQETEDLMSFAAAHAEVVAAARAVGKAVQKVQRGARGNAPEIGELCLELSASIAPFVSAVSSASGAVTEPELRQHLMQEAGRTCDETARLCEVARAIASNPSDKLYSDLSLVFKACTDALGGAVHGIRDAAVGEKECRDAAVKISRLQTDLDSAMIFAETGHLQSEERQDLSEINANFEKSAKACLAKAKGVTAAMSSQTELAAAAKAFAQSLETLARDCKSVAVAIGDFVEFDQQKSVLVGTRGALVRAQAVVLAASHGAEEDEMASLTKVLGQELVALNKSVKEAAGAALQTQSAISKAREVIVASRDGYDSLRAGKVEAKEVAEALTQVSRSASTIIAAASKNSGKELLASLDEMTEAMSDFLQKAKGAEKLSKSNNIGSSSLELASCIIDLLDVVNQRTKDDWETAERIAGFSDTVADHVAEVTTALKTLPGQKVLELEENALGEEVVDSLKVAVKAVQSETDKLRTPEGAKKGDVGALLVSAASAIITATAGMLKASTATQEELLARAKTNARLNVFQRDPAWAKGLMGNVDELVRFTSFLVVVTNKAASTDLQNIGGAIEDLSKAARNVSSGSSKLVASAKAKSDSSSSSLQRLTTAGQAVSSATQALIEAGKHAAEIARQNSSKADKEPYDFSKRIDQGELKAQLEISRLERELERSKAAAKVKAELKDSWTESSRKAPSEIDRKMAAKKQAAEKEDSSKKLQEDVKAAKLAAQKKIAKVEQKSQPSKTSAQKKKVEESDESDDDRPLPAVGGGDDDDDDVPAALPPPVSDDEE